MIAPVMLFSAISHSRLHELPHYRMHVHHMLLRDVLVELVDYHNRKQDAGPSRKSAQKICGCSQYANEGAAHDGQGADVSRKDSLEDAGVAPEPRDLQA